MYAIGIFLLVVKLFLEGTWLWYRLLEYSTILRGEWINIEHFFTIFNISRTSYTHSHYQFHHIRSNIVHKYFYMETQNVRKPQNAFLTSNKDYIHFLYENQLKQACNPLNLIAPTRRKNMHQLVVKKTNPQWSPPCLSTTFPLGHLKALIFRRQQSPFLAPPNHPYILQQLVV